jgi:hypothetical protein
MNSNQCQIALGRVFDELIDGAAANDGALVLNTGDIGLLQSLDRMPAAEASRSVNGGATIAAHVQHLAYGLSLMNRWAAEGGDPFAAATWDAAWKTSAVGDGQWREIRQRLHDESHRWLAALRAPREVSELELAGMIASVAHLAYHLGAIRQISKDARGPREGTFSQRTVDNQ